MKFFTKIKIWWLKRKARSLVQRAAGIAKMYNCGHKLLKEISPSYVSALLELDRIGKELIKIDPKAPKETLMDLIEQSHS